MPAYQLSCTDGISSLLSLSQYLFVCFKRCLTVHITKYTRTSCGNQPDANAQKKCQQMYDRVGRKEKRRRRAMQLLYSHNPWSLRYGPDPTINFCCWILLLDG